MPAEIPLYVARQEDNPLLQRFSDAVRQNIDELNAGENPAVRQSSLNDLSSRVDRLNRQTRETMQAVVGGSVFSGLEPHEISGTDAVAAKVGRMYLKQDADIQELDLPDPTLGSRIVCIQNGTANQLKINVNFVTWNPNNPASTYSASDTITMNSRRSALEFYGLGTMWAAWLLYGTVF